MSNILTLKVGGLTVRMDELGELQKLLEAASRGEMPITTAVEAPAPAPAVSRVEVPTADLQVLHKSGMSSHTIVMVARKELHVDTNSQRLAQAYPNMAVQASQWLQRPITEKYPFLYVSSIEIPHLGPGTAVVGLNSDKQLVVLALETDTDVKRVLRTMIARGFKALPGLGVVLGFDRDIEAAVMETFPKAQVLRCWTEMIANAPEKYRETLRDMEQSPSLKVAIKRFEQGPKDLVNFLKPMADDLLAHYEYSSNLWRVLRRASPIHRLQEELRQKIKAEDDRTAWLLTTWTCLRLQYQWHRIPVDSPQLSSLKYMKGEVSTEPASNRGIRRRSTESEKES